MKQIVHGKVAEECIGEISREVIADAILKYFGQNVEIFGPENDGRFRFMVSSGSRCEETLATIRRVFSCIFVNKTEIRTCSPVEVLDVPPRKLDIKEAAHA